MSIGCISGPSKSKDYEKQCLLEWVNPSKHIRRTSDNGIGGIVWDTAHYCIGSGGNIFSHSDPEANDKMNPYQFKAGDVLHF
jgi:hypothetical protein